jgi:hypothetical protein
MSDIDSITMSAPTPELIPETYVVRTGRRPGFGVQLYFIGQIPVVGLFEVNGCKGQVKSLGGVNGARRRSRNS